MLQFTSGSDRRIHSSTKRTSSPTLTRIAAAAVAGALAVNLSTPALEMNGGCDSVASLPRNEGGAPPIGLKTVLQAPEPDVP